LDNLHSILADDRLTGFDMKRALYLDIEATGLSHGAGTLAFLIGMCSWEDESLWLEQIFVDSPSCELAALSYFRDRLNSFPYLVSFNGKSYDLSVLQTRLVLNRLLTESESNIKLKPHLDLLHAARQAYRGVFPNTRLQTLEREALGLDASVRADDVPGSLVPALYFHFLQTGLVSPLEGVLTHNHTDTTSLVDLTTHLLTLLAPGEDCVHPRVLYNLGRAALQRKLYTRSIALFERAQANTTVEPAVEQRLISLALVTAYRRAGRLEEAMESAVTAMEHTPSHDNNERERLSRQIQRFQNRMNREQHS